MTKSGETKVTSLFLEYSKTFYKILYFVHITFIFYIRDVNDLVLTIAMN